MSTLKNSKVLLINNTEKFVQDLRIGDLVWGINPHTKHLAVAEVTQINLLECDNLYAFQDFYISKNQQIFGCNLGGSFKFRHFCKMLRKDATYFAMKYRADYIRNSVDCEQFNLGYLRGFVDGDGHIGDGIIDRGVWVGQKLPDILKEFWSIYNDVISLVNINVHMDINRGMFVGKGGNANFFRNKTNYNFNNNEYMWGYLNGMIMADGALCYNKNNGSFHIDICQSSSANLEKCEKITTCLDKLNIKYHVWDSVTHGFKQGGTVMRGWRIPYPFIVSLVYGQTKKNEFFTKLQERCTTKILPSIQIKKFNKMNFLQDISYDVQTSAGTYFCNGYLFKCVGTQ